MTGTIVTIVKDHGYFFVRSDDGRQYFAHRSALQNPTWMYSIQEGDAVTFNPIESSPKGPRADAIVVSRMVA